MKANEFFQSKSRYFRTSDLSAGEQLTATIAGVTKAEFGADGEPKETKPVVEFQDHGRSLVANKTNFNILATLFGDETDRWVGQRITLKAARVPFRGKMIDSIQVARFNAADDVF